MGMTDLLLIHGLTYDHHTWDLLLPHLDPDRRVLAIDLPGHGDNTPQDSYRLDQILATVHRQVTEAGLTDPVVVGHSAGAVIATAYAARYPATAVVNVDQILVLGQFGEILRSAEPLLRSPQWGELWNRMLANMGIDALPDEARKIVETATTPRQDLLLGYWDDILRHTDEEVNRQRQQELEAIGERGIAYRWVSSYQPPQEHLQWLNAILPVQVDVVPGSHFPHLSSPSTVADLIPA
jgi:pimeloyl-ACP methyl ester carboxylesterase